MESSHQEDNILEIRGLTKTYSSRSETITAVDDLDLDIYRGEIFSLLGPNGAGKTTVFRIITTLEPPTEGTIRVDGFDTKNEPDKVREILGLVPQATGLYDKLTAKETLELMASLYNVPKEKADERIEELLKLVNLKDRKDSLVDGFSGGMKQRLSLAAGLIHRPKLLLLDEPTTGLDPQTRRRLWNLIEDLNEEGVTVLINTHIMEEADALSDRVGIMRDGRLAEVDTPRTLKRVVEGGEAIEIFIPAEYSDKTGTLLEENELVESIEYYDSRLRIITNNRKKALSEFPNLIRNSGIPLEGIETREKTLEDAFIHLTEGD